MVAIAEERKKTVPGVICPHCAKFLPYPHVMPAHKLERYGLSMRTYFGWCFLCNLGCEVIQFRLGLLWHIHKFRSYTINGVDDKPKRGDWQTSRELPVALVLLGPGGNYCDAYDLTAKAGQ